MKLKRFTAALLCIALLGLSACAAPEKDTTAAEQTAPPGSTTAGERTTSEEITPEEENSSQEMTSYPVPVTAKPLFDDSITLENYPKIGNTEFFLKFTQQLFRYNFALQLGDGMSLDERYPVSSQSEAELIVALKNGEIDIAFIDKKFDDESFEQELKYTYLGYASVCFVIWYENPIDGLTSEQLRGVYSGKIKNWQELGGTDEQIALPDLSASCTAPCALLKQYFGSDSLADNGSLIPMYAEMSGPGFIEYTMLVQYLFCQTCDSRFQNGCKMISVDGIEPTAENSKSGRYPLSYKVYAVTKKNVPGDSPVQKIIDGLLIEEENDNQSMLFTNGGIFLPYGEPGDHFIY